MNTNGIYSTTYGTSAASYDKKTGGSKSKSASSADKDVKKEDAVVYEKGNGKDNADSVKKTYKRDNATINNLLNEVKQRQQQLQDLVEKTLLKQGKTLGVSESIFDVLKAGNVEFAPEDIAQAKKDVAEDGYWGVEQTSERLYSFAFALTGGDPSQADKMMAAIEKGFQAATKSWGQNLPDICNQTLEATREKINAWKNGGAAEGETVE